MTKIEFITKLETVKARLPTGVIPLYLKAFPDSDNSRLRNTIAGKIQDEKILDNLIKIAEKIESI